MHTHTNTHILRLIHHVHTYMHLHMHVYADAFLSCSPVKHRWRWPWTTAIARWRRCSCSTAPSEGACLGARLPPSLAQIAAGCLDACHMRRRIHAVSRHLNAWMLVLDYFPPLKKERERALCFYTTCMHVSSSSYGMQRERALCFIQQFESQFFGGRNICRRDFHSFPFFVFFQSPPPPHWVNRRCLVECSSLFPWIKRKRIYQLYL
jgi:hypothetical protein